VRRVVTYVVLGLGVFAVALGLLLKLYTYPRVAKIPVDPNSVVYAEASNATALMYIKQDSGATLPEIKSGLTLKVTRSVRGFSDQPEVTQNGDVASWKEGVDVVDASSGNRVLNTERQLCLDRRTNEAVQPCTTQYVKNKVSKSFEAVREDNVFQPGISLKFPFDAEKRSYQMFDLTLRQSVEAKFDGEDQLNGLDVYRYVQDIPATKLESRDVPGALLGESETIVKADLFYQNKRTVWVEPVTGQIIKGSEEQLQELRLPTEDTGTAVFKGTLTFTDATVADNVNKANDNKSKLGLLTTLPIILWIVGPVLIVVAVLMLLFWVNRGSRRDQAPPQPSELADATR
jgi:hypothetical protein